MVCNLLSNNMGFNMARTGLYKSQVKKARDALVLQNRHPSVDAVRIELGNTGSKTTIHKYLKELELDGGGHERSQAGLSDELNKMISLLAVQLREEANRSLVEVQAKALEAEKKHIEGVLILHNEIDQSKKQLQHSDQSVIEERQAHESTRLTLQEETINRHTLAQEVRDLKERLTENEVYRQSLEEKHQHACDALVHYRESVKVQREQDQQRHEQQVQHLQAELRQVQQTVIVKQDELTHLNQDKTRLLTDLRHAQEEVAQEQMAHHNTREKLKVSELLNSQIDVLNIQIADKNALLVAAHSQFEDKVRLVEALNAQVQALQLELASERAKLEAQRSISDEIRSLWAKKTPSTQTDV